ncbi:hypothetical protein ACFQE1_00100 [Halobium palmae]|uniref:Secreted protein n=1 Tax=Halobium palmae TaxID=1776492 RepID=A0ABD5RV62_9EURY
MVMIARIIVALVAIPSTHPPLSVMVLNVGNMEIAVRVELNLDIRLRNLLFRIVMTYEIENE